jgi:hypothetical protein
MFQFQDIVPPTADTTRPPMFHQRLLLVVVTLSLVWQLYWLLQICTRIQPRLVTIGAEASEPRDPPAPSVPSLGTGGTINPLPSTLVGQDEPERPFLGRRRPLRPLATLPRVRTPTPEPSTPPQPDQPTTLDQQPLHCWPEPKPHLKVHLPERASADARESPEVQEVQGVREAPGPSRDGIGVKR